MKYLVLALLVALSLTQVTASHTQELRVNKSFVVPKGTELTITETLERYSVKVEAGEVCVAADDASLMVDEILQYTIAATYEQRNSNPGGSACLPGSKVTLLRSQAQQLLVLAGKNSEKKFTDEFAKMLADEAARKGNRARESDK